MYKEKTFPWPFPRYYDSFVNWDLETASVNCTISYLYDSNKSTFSLSPSIRLTSCNDWWTLRREKEVPLLKFYLFVSQDNPYLALQMDEEVQPSSGYYLQPVDNAGVREFKRYVKSPVQSPTSDTQEPPQFEDLEGGQYRCVFYDILNSRTCS